MLNRRNIIIFMLFLLFPVFVKAEGVYYDAPSFEYAVCIGNDSTLVFSDDVIYENGVYKLTGNLVTNKTRYLDVSNGRKEYYTCNSDSETECENAYIVYVDKSCMAFYSSNHKLSIKLSNGMKKEDVEYYYVADDYEEKNGTYTLVNPEKYNARDITSSNYISRVHEEKYFCVDNYGITCNQMVYLRSRGNTFSYGEPVDRYYLVGDGYVKEDGKYRLLNPKRVLGGTFADLIGYTCRSKEDTCDELYTVSISGSFDNHDGGRLNYFTLLDVLDTSLDVALKINDSYNLFDFFDEDEIDEMINTNPRVADFKNGKLELYEIGETLFVIEDDFNYKALHIVVLEDTLEDEIEEKPIINPNTRDVLFLLLGIFGISFVLVFLLKKKNRII